MSKPVVITVIMRYPPGNPHRKDKKIFYTHWLVMHFMTSNEPMKAMLLLKGQAGCSTVISFHP
jgi:hypothetical protein